MLPTTIVSPQAAMKDVTIVTRDKTPDRVQVRNEGLIIGRRRGEGIVLQRSGEVLAYIELGRHNTNQAKLRVMAEPGIQINRTIEPSA